MAVRAKLREVAQAAAFDPKKALLDSLGDISGFEVFHNLVLVATYIEPEKTAGGIIKPDRTLAENRFQGKCALVLKKGPRAFKDDEFRLFGGADVHEHDWVVVRPSDGMELFTVDENNKSTGTSCRLFEDTSIKGRVDDPGLIW
jgi:hypothetical protein